MSGTSLHAKLDRLDKAALIDLIENMIDRHQDLSLLVDLAVTDTERSVDTEAVRDQVRQVYRHAEDSWDASFGMSIDLERILDTGHAYAAQGDWRNAAAVYAAVADEIMIHYEEVHDEEGEIALKAASCMERLGVCLAETTEEAEREAMLRTLWRTFAWDTSLGGYGVAGAVPEIILDQATPEERRRVVRWVREALPPGDPLDETTSYGNWRQNAYGRLLLDLQEDELDDDAYLRICRETGLWKELVTRLLERERVEEAVDFTSRVGSRFLLSLAAVFEEFGHADAVEPVVRADAEENEDYRTLGWLKNQAERRGALDEALAYGERLFWSSHTVERYAEMKRLAQALDAWGAMRPALEERLTGKRAYAFLTDMHLFEGEVDEAIRTLGLARKQTTSGRRRSSVSSAHTLTLRVAKAAEEEHPMESVRLYRLADEDLIADRGRSNYAAAAHQLTRVRALYLRLDDEEGWKTCIHEIRDGNRMLRALKDELNKAGL